jgi:hypothetical protein
MQHTLITHIQKIEAAGRYLGIKAPGGKARKPLSAIADACQNMGYNVFGELSSPLTPAQQKEVYRSLYEMEKKWLTTLRQVKDKAFADELTQVLSTELTALRAAVSALPTPCDIDGLLLLVQD